MKFNVSSTKLFAQLQTISRVIAPKSTLPILEKILFDLNGNNLVLTASDGETTIRTSVEVESAEGAGKVASSAKLLVDTLKEFPEQPLSFTIDDANYSITMVSPNGTYSFIGTNGDEYPEMQAIEEGSHQLTLGAGVLLNAITKTLPFTANDELRPVMNGIFFDITTEGITFVATDAHRLVRYTNQTAACTEEVNFILPKKPATLLKNILSKSEAPVTISFGQKNARFEWEGAAIVTRLIDGRYPNYKAVIPQNNTNIVVVDRQTLINACRRVAVFANTGTALLRLCLNENQIKISAQDIDLSTSAEETIACEYTGMQMAIGFKAPFLIEILGTIDSTDVKLQLSDPARAGLLLPTEQAENEDLLLLLMPMLLQDN